MPRKTRNNDSSSMGKVRTSQACNQCRKRKSKCGGEQPCCSMCETAGRECTYDHQSRKRGLQSGYVRSLEIVLGLVFHHLPHSDSRIHDVLQAQHQKDTFLEGNKGEFFAARWRRSDVARNLGHLLLQSASRDSSCISEQHTGQSSPLVLDVMDMEMEVLTESENIEGCRSKAAHIKINQSTQTSSIATSSTHELLSTGIPPQTIDLVDLYLEYTQPWFPIIERSSILRSVHTSISDCTTNDRHDIGMRLCLWAIIAFMVSNRSLADVSLQPEEIQMRVRAAVLEDDQNFELGHIQALMILVLLKIALAQLDTAWTLSAQASRMSMIYVKRQSTDKARTCHTIRGSIFIDILLSRILDLSTCWSDEALASFQGSAIIEGIEEWQTWKPVIATGADTLVGQRQPLRALSVFSYTTETMQRLDKSLTSMKESDDGNEFLQDHQTWKTRLPTFCWLPAHMPSSPPVLLLHLTWHLAVCNFAGKLEVLTTRILQQTIESIDSMLDIINKLCSVVHPAAYSPLLICYTMQIHQSVHKLNRANLLGPGKDEGYRQVLEKLRNVWQADSQHCQYPSHDTLQTFIPPQPDASNNANPSEARPSVHAPTRQNRSPKMDSASTISSADRFHEQVDRAEQPLNYDLPNTEDAMDSMNDFDAYLFEMSLVPPTRDSEQTRLLSQNLGFLDENFIDDYPDIF